jgi:RND family efflux transporter MFP subunit
MFTVVRSDVLELAAAVPARSANVVQIGQTVHFAADGRNVEGRVARVSPTIDPATRSLTVYAQIPNPGNRIKGGTFASGRVVSRVISGALRVPTAAIRQSQENGQPYVYRIVDRVIDVAQIQLGAVDDRSGVAEVLSGLSEGDRVVVGNVGTLGRGMQVQVVGGEAGAGPGGARGAAARTPGRS